jgi:tetratricopeptide (TPR) repeat protein
VDGDLRVLRNRYLDLGDLQNDDCGVDDLDGATDAYAHAKRLSLLIAKGKTIATSTAANTIDKSAQSVHLVEGASSDTGIPDDRGHSEWSPNDDEQLAAGKVRFPSGRAHRWRDIAKFVGKNEEACRSRARCETFIKRHLYPGENEEDKLEGAERTATPELDLNDSSRKVEADETEGLKVEAEVRGSVLDSAGASQAETDAFDPPSNLAALFDMMGMPNHASITRWLEDHNNLSGLRIVAREGLDEDADDSAESFLKLGIVLHEEGNLPAAERAFRMAISGRPMDPEPYLYFGNMLEGSGRALEAEKMYRKANFGTPDFAEAFKDFVGEELYARHPSLRHSTGRGDTPTEIATPLYLRAHAEFRTRQINYPVHGLN